MNVRFVCPNCDRTLRAGSRFVGARARCPACGQLIEVPQEPSVPSTPTRDDSPLNSSRGPFGQHPGPSGAEGVIPAEAVINEIVEFLDPPAMGEGSEQNREPKVSVTRRMFEAMLDPRSIQWMLFVGGALSVLGFIIWVVSLGVFESRFVVAVALGIGTLVVLSAGWAVSLKTPYKTAGHALTFLGCVVMPLNLWYYEAQNLVRLENLWIGGIFCCAFYVLTVRILRTPLFMYAVEAGITLTVLLLLAGLSLPFNSTLITIGFMVMGLMSIHAERVFPPDHGEFRRGQYGLPLFWSGHVQLGISLIALIVLQANDIINNYLGAGELEHRSLAGGLWLAGAYAYLYSDLVVRRVGLYVYLAAVAFLASLLTLVAGYFNWEVAIVVLTVTALAANAFERRAAVEQRFARVVAPLGIVLGGVPLLLGWLLHVRATSDIVMEFGWHRATDGWFVGTMLAVAIGTRMSAWLYRKSAPRRTMVHLFYSAAALIIAAAGLLRVMDIVQWSRQAPLLMLIPIAYLIAARLWRGQVEERALGWVARTGAAVILIHGLLSVIDVRAMLVPAQGEVRNLLLGILFVEATVFYSLIATFRHASSGGYLTAASACAAMWQFLGYLEVPPYLHTSMFAVLGITVLGLARVLRIEEFPIYRPSGHRAVKLQGRGRGAFQAGNAILSIAFLAAFFQGVSRLASPPDAWGPLLALSLTTVASCVAIGAVPGGAWRRIYAAYSIALAGLVFLTLNLYIELNGWQKLELFCAVTGTMLVVGGYIGRFKEREDKPSEAVDLALGLGTLLVTVPLLVAVIYHRFFGAGVSLLDEMALVAMTLLLLITGLSWQVKYSTVFGGGTLIVYLCILLGTLVHRPQLSQGAYLAISGLVVFIAGIVLSIYRDRLLALPDKMARREGIFRIIGWR